MCWAVGQGGQGTVWKGQLGPNKQVAVKGIQRHELLGDRGFTQELEVLAKMTELNTRNVIDLLYYQDEKHDGMFYLVMPLMCGDLSSQLPKMNAQQRLHALLGAFCGLDALHSADFLQ